MRTQETTHINPLLILAAAATILFFAIDLLTPKLSLTFTMHGALQHAMVKQS